MSRPRTRRTRRPLKLVGQDAEESSGPSIEDADVIVAGGRGLGSPDNFTLAEELAKALGGAVGATRAVVDAGWYPYSAQIGRHGPQRPDRRVEEHDFQAKWHGLLARFQAGLDARGKAIVRDRSMNDDPVAPDRRCPPLSG